MTDSAHEDAHLMDAVDYAEKATELFVLSDSFVRIKELIDDERSTIDDIGDVILLDPALSGTLLKLANSSFFNYPGKIDTISKAVLVLGITEVYNLVIAYFTTEAFKSIDADQEYLGDFWSKSVDCALIIKYLGTHLSIPNAERLFILGLLHNLGELVVQQFSPEKVEAIADNAEDNYPWEKQQQALEFSYGECTAELLKLWQLPFSLVEPIRYQDDEDFELSTLETKLLYLSKRIAFKNSVNLDMPVSYFASDEKFESCQVSEELVEASIAYCDLERLGILAILNPSSAMIY
jgi:HD-like signal output (HDOD) protein